MRARSEGDVTCVSILVGSLGCVFAALGAGMTNAPRPGVAALGAVILVFSLLAIFVAVILLSAGKSKVRTDAQREQAKTFGAPQIRIRPRLRCPFCHDGISGRTQECPACKAIYHTECLEEARGCTTLGCEHAAAKRRVRL